MAESRAAAGTAWSLSHALLWPVRSIAGNIRVTVIISVALICGTFMAAATLQMRNDRTHALAEAAAFDAERADEIALDLGAALNRYAAIGTAFTNAASSAETSAALAEAGGSALRNIAVLDDRGDLQSEMTSAPKGFLPLTPETLAGARAGHAIAASRDGKSFAIVFGVGSHIVAVELNAKTLMPSASEKEALLSSLAGEVVAVGADWRALPSVEALALGNQAQASRVIDVADGARLVALRRVDGWPLAVVASSRVGEALDAWYGSLPLYFFVIFGPALAGAALAVIFVREFERRARAAEAVRTLKATKPDKARLLVRLAEAERRATDAERARREFVAHMSHELRTPLNAIIGFSEVMTHEMFGPVGSPRYLEYAKVIHESGSHLLELINGILDMSKIEAGKFDLGEEIFDLEEVAAQAVRFVKLQSERKGVALKTAIAPSARAMFADKRAVKQMLVNLLTNGVKFTPRGGEVRIDAARQGETVLIAVSDTGVGIGPEDLKRLGRPFEQVEGEHVRSQEGTGLGLALVKALAALHGGDVAIVSVLGEGTTVTVTLPFAGVSETGEPLSVRDERLKGVA